MNGQHHFARGSLTLCGINIGRDLFNGTWTADPKQRHRVDCGNCVALMPPVRTPGKPLSRMQAEEWLGA